MGIFNATFFKCLRRKGHFFIYFYIRSLARTKKRVFAKQLSLSPFHIYCQCLCSVASIQFDAIMCQIAVSSEDTSKRRLFPFVSGLSFSLKRGDSKHRNGWVVCLIRLSKVSRTNGKVSQESCFQLHRRSCKNKLNVMNELTFLSQHNVVQRNLKKKIHWVILILVLYGIFADLHMTAPCCHLTFAQEMSME